MNFSGQGGPVNISDGANNGIALGRQSELLVTEYHGRYKEIASRGTMFHGVMPATTVVSANTSPIASGAASLLTLYNPFNSGKNLAILRHHIATISGTPGGPLLWNFVSSVGPLALAAASLLPIYPGNLSGSSPSVARLFTQQAGSGLGAQTLLKIAQSISAATAALAASITASAEEEAGSLVLPPGTGLSLAAYAVGTSHVLMASLSWEENPV